MMKVIAICAVCVALAAALPVSELAQSDNVTEAAGGHWIKTTDEVKTPGQYQGDWQPQQGQQFAPEQAQPVWDHQEQAQPEWDGNFTEGAFPEQQQPQMTRWGRPYKPIVQKKAVGEYTQHLAPIVHNYAVPLPALHDEVRQEGFTRDVPVQTSQVRYTHQEIPQQVGQTVQVPQTHYVRQPYQYRTFKQVPETRQVPVTQYKTQHYQTAQKYTVPQYHQVTEVHNVTQVHYKPVVTVHYIPQKEVHYVPVKTEVPVRTYHTEVVQKPQQRQVEHYKQVPVHTQQKQVSYHAVPVQHTAYRQIAQTAQVPQQHMVRQYHQQTVAHRVPVQQHEVVHYQRQIIDEPHYVDQEPQQHQIDDLNTTIGYDHYEPQPTQYAQPPQYSQPVFQNYTQGAFPAGYPVQGQQFHDQQFPDQVVPEDEDDEDDEQESEDDEEDDDEKKK